MSKVQRLAHESKIRAKSAVGERLPRAVGDGRQRASPNMHGISWQRGEGTSNSRSPRRTARFPPPRSLKGSTARTLTISNCMQLQCGARTIHQFAKRRSVGSNDAVRQSQPCAVWRCAAAGSAFITVQARFCTSSLFSRAHMARYGLDPRSSVRTNLLQLSRLCLFSCIRSGHLSNVRRYGLAAAGQQVGA